jgi:hypothetical protein
MRAVLLVGVMGIPEGERARARLKDIGVGGKNRIAQYKREE